MLAIRLPGSAYVYMFGIALFGGLFVWLMIFVTHLGFRKYRRAHGGRTSGDNAPVPLDHDPRRGGSVGDHPFDLVGGGMRLTLETGIPWLLLLTVIYYVWGRKRTTVR